MYTDGYRSDKKLWVPTRMFTLTFQRSWPDHGSVPGLYIRGQVTVVRSRIYGQKKNFGYWWVPGTGQKKNFGYRWVPTRKKIFGTGYRSDKKLWVPMSTGYKPEKNLGYRCVPGTGQKKKDFFYRANFNLCRLLIRRLKCERSNLRAPTLQG